MIALSILSLTALMIIEFKENQIRNLSILEEKMQAGWVADNQLALLKLAHSEQKLGPHNGKVMMGKRIWYWRVQLLPEEKLLQAIDLDVSLHPDFSVLSASIRTYLSVSDKPNRGNLY
ncbi:General secretion pathway protein I [Candidatus Hamiltonella defensa (Bemisia tabaci)]|uniref:Type II secretion system protein I n=2 Tax=Candidatus Williamhamiltonella defendens TaxID=138072 RepID=A0A249DW45_9ENTR|nr:type II secretion system protein GspI [Candidatus Hamiltonella defensa (Bemisia tabaci)]CED78947.1 General secretion pathway protein I [Candidatus Hamiltonella defensa (Bemisia tabaci)]